MDKLTFKDYLDSKERLRQAIEETPIASTKYTVKKYCKLRIGESRDTRQEVALKPKQSIVVEWRYDNIDDPDPSYVVLEENMGDDELPIYWSGEKLRDWLSKNTFEDLNFNSDFY